MTSNAPQVGDRRSYDGAICTVRYVGEVAGTSGSWLGVEWDDAGRGKHDGSHKGVRYFKCKSRSATAASFVRPTRPADAPKSFVAALREKYTAELSNAGAIQFSGKVAEEVGFEKIRRKQARLDELRYAVLDGSCIAAVYDGDSSSSSEGDRGKGEGGRNDGGGVSIAETCPKVFNLELSRNLFTRIGAVVAICAELPDLRNLRLNGNRFQDVFQDEDLNSGEKSLAGIKELALEETLLDWEEIIHIATKFPSLELLTASTNQLSYLPQVPFASLASTLTILTLEFNDFTTIADVASVAALPALRNLHLKGNNISCIRSNSSSSSSPETDASSSPLPVFSATLHYLDVSYNQVSSWYFIDDLPSCFPGLTSLRFAHNPVYDNPDPEHSAANSKNVTEEAYMFTVGRLGKLKSLNFGAVSAQDRENAEMFYLARIGKQLASVPEAREPEILRGHRRYGELCEMYGPPVVNRTREINPAFLEARLINAHFFFQQRDKDQRGGKIQEQTARIPKSLDIYAVKGIVGRLFGVKPLGLRLVWETGEWDPVAGFDDEIEDSSSEDDEGEEIGQKEESRSGEKPGKWVKREVELADGPRQLGFCIDGLEARIRVEMR